MLREKGNKCPQHSCLELNTVIIKDCGLRSLVLQLASLVSQENLLEMRMFGAPNTTYSIKLWEAEAAISNMLSWWFCCRPKCEDHWLGEILKYNSTWTPPRTLDLTSLGWDPGIWRPEHANYFLRSHPQLRTTGLLRFAPNDINTHTIPPGKQYRNIIWLNWIC